MKQVKIYTDGACSGNPGPGGWACILVFKNVEKEKSGYEANTTNNRMELTAVIEGLTLLKEPCEVEVLSDSAYVINAFNQGWIENWISANWKRGKQKNPVLNKDLWKKLLNLCDRHQIKWTKVKGHSGDKYNEAADKLAVSAIKTNHQAGH